MWGGVKGAKNIRIHLNGHISFGYQFLVSGLHTGLNPVRKGSANDRVRDIYDPLPWKLANIVLVRVIQESFGIFACLCEKLFDSEALVLWHGQMLDAVWVQKLLFSLNERFQEIYGHAVVRRQVCMTLNCHEVVPIYIVRLQIIAYTSRFERYLDANIAAVIVCTARSLAGISIQIL